MAEAVHMSVDEKIKKAFSLKDEGSQLFKASDYQGAIRKYHHAILHVKGLDNGGMAQALGMALSNDNKDINQESKKNIKELELMCYNNLAACLLKKENYEKVIEYSTKAIAVEPNNPKALFRRGTAYFSLKNFCKAEEDFNKILAANPKERSVQKYLTVIQTQNKEKEKNLYSKMF